MNKFQVNGFALVSTKSPPNTGRIVILKVDIGIRDIPTLGSTHIWRVTPVSDYPLSTQRLSKESIPSKMYFVPEDWLIPITIDDPNLDSFLAEWALDDVYYRSSE